MPRCLALVLLTVTLGAGGCHRSGPGPLSPQPIRDEKEPGESLDYVSAVPDTGSSSAEEMTSTSSENEVEIDDGPSAGDDSKASEKSADKSDDQPGDEGEGEGGEDETGDEPDDIESGIDDDVGSQP